MHAGFEIRKWKRHRLCVVFALGLSLFLSVVQARENISACPSEAVSNIALSSVNCAEKGYDKPVLLREGTIPQRTSGFFWRNAREHSPLALFSVGSLAVGGLFYAIQKSSSGPQVIHPAEDPSRVNTAMAFAGMSAFISAAGYIYYTWNF